MYIIYIMKILLLIIYSENELYDKMIKAQRNYIHKFENVDSYFIQNSTKYNEPIVFENDMIHVIKANNLRDK